MTVTESTLRKKLEQIIQDDLSSVRAEVASVALDRECIETFFRDLLRVGCISGFVGSMIYYSDTWNFYDAHYTEIEEMRIEWEESIGEAIRINGDLKNSLAWFAFEETAYQIANEIGLEI